MKIFLSFFFGLIIGAGSFSLFHRQVQGNGTANGANKELAGLHQGKATQLVASTKDVRIPRKPSDHILRDANALRAIAHIPSRSTADWTREERDVDQRFGIVYRICALLPSERDLVRKILTRESLLASARKKLISSGVQMADADRMLAADQSLYEADSAQLERDAPEVSAFLGLCRSHPDALADTSAIAERILNETGSVDPDVADLIFSASVKADSTHPMPSYVDRLEFNDRSNVELDAVEKNLFQRNSTLIPALSSKLAPNQMVAVISYYEEQLDAVMKQKEINAPHN